MRDKNYLQKLKTQKINENNPDAIQCKICGNWYIQVGSHVVQAHGILMKEYKKKFGYDLYKGLIKGELKKKKRDINLAGKQYKQIIEPGKQFRFKKGHKSDYKRSPETLKRLSELGKSNKKY